MVVDDWRAGGLNDTLQPANQRRAIVSGHSAEQAAHVLAKLADGGILKGSAARRDLDEDQPAIGCALGAGEHLARLQTVHSFGDRGGLQIHSFGKFSDGDGFIVDGKQVQCHELRGAEAGFLKVVEVRRLDDLTDGEPSPEEPRDFLSTLIADTAVVPVHTTILQQ